MGTMSRGRVMSAQVSCTHNLHQTSQDQTTNAPKAFPPCNITLPPGPLTAPTTYIPTLLLARWTPSANLPVCN